MGGIAEVVERGVEQLLGRAGGPLHFRLLVMPLAVTFLAIRAGRRDAREGRPAFLWGMASRPGERARLLRSAAKDIGRVVVVALVLDITYQIMVFHTVYPGQLLVVAMALAILPYVLVRGPVTRLSRHLARGRAARADRGGGS
jgi:hypothetical protein